MSAKKKKKNTMRPLHLLVVKLSEASAGCGAQSLWSYVGQSTVTTENEMNITRAMSDQEMKLHSEGISTNYKVGEVNRKSKRTILNCSTPVSAVDKPISEVGWVRINSFIR